jgi:hypothetical protein
VHGFEIAALIISDRGGYARQRSPYYDGGARARFSRAVEAADDASWGSAPS